MAAERIGTTLLAEALAAPTRLRGALLGDLGDGTASADTVGDEDLSGSRAGPYLLQRRLARGGMGDVYFAADHSGAGLTVKVLRRGMDSAELVRRSHRERGHWPRCATAASSNCATPACSRTAGPSWSLRS